MNFPRPSTPIFWGSATAMVSSGIALVSDSLRELPVSVTVAAVMTGISGVIAAAGGIKVSLVKIAADQKQFEMKMLADQKRLELELTAEQKKLELESAWKRHDLADKLNVAVLDLANAKDEIQHLRGLLNSFSKEKKETLLELPSSLPPKES